MKEQSALDTALEQLRIAAEKLNLDPGIHEMLKHPKRSLVAESNITMQEDPSKEEYVITRMLH